MNAVESIPETIVVTQVEVEKKPTSVFVE